MKTSDGELSLMLIDDWFWKTAGALAFLKEFELDEKPLLVMKAELLPIIWTELGTPSEVE